MKIKILGYAICIFILVLIQSTILDFIKIFNVKPNLLIIFTISVALLTNNVEGAVIGFFTGLSQDIVSGKVLGFYSLLGLYLGFIIGSVNKRLYRENVMIIIFFTFVSTVVYELIVCCINFFTNGQIQLLYSLKVLILPEAIYNSIVSIFIYIFIIKMYDKLESMDKYSRKY
jgi:rod shape-determining protein MreD